MNPNRTNAIAAGIFFILAAVASITGLLCYDAILNDPDYIVHASAHTAIQLGAFFEVLTAFAVIGTSVALYPILKKFNPSMALACVGFRLLEASMIIIGILCLLTIVSLNLEWQKELHPDISSYTVTGKSLLAFHNWTFLYGPNLLLGPSTLMTSYLLSQSKQVPRIICYLGMAGGPLIFLCALFVTFGLFLQISVWGVVMALPVFCYEMSLAIWLLTRGFKYTTAEAAPVQNLFRLAAKDNR